MRKSVEIFICSILAAAVTPVEAGQMRSLEGSGALPLTIIGAPNQVPPIETITAPIELEFLFQEELGIQLEDAQLKKHPLIVEIPGAISQWTTVPDRALVQMNMQSGGGHESVKAA